MLRRGSDTPTAQIGCRTSGSPVEQVQLTPAESLRTPQPGRRGDTVVKTVGSRRIPSEAPDWLSIRLMVHGNLAWNHGPIPTTTQAGNVNRRDLATPYDGRVVWPLVGQLSGRRSGWCRSELSANEGPGAREAPRRELLFRVEPTCGFQKLVDQCRVDRPPATSVVERRGRERERHWPTRSVVNPCILSCAFSACDVMAVTTRPLRDHDQGGGDGFTAGLGCRRARTDSGRRASGEDLGRRAAGTCRCVLAYR